MYCIISVKLKTMKLTLEQRTKLFNIVKETVLKNIDKVKVLSAEMPNQSFIYEDDRYEILYNYNQYGVGASTGDLVQISLTDKKLNECVKFDSTDYVFPAFMRGREDMLDMASKIRVNIFAECEDETEDQLTVNKILGL